MYLIYVFYLDEHLLDPVRIIALGHLMVKSRKVWDEALDIPSKPILVIGHTARLLS